MRDKVRYVLIEKVLTKVTGECNYFELETSDSAMEILEALMDNLKIHQSWGELIEMSDKKTFLLETCEKIYLYSIEVKRDPVKAEFEADKDD